MTTRKQFKAFEIFLFDQFVLTLEGMIYFFAAAGPLYGLWLLRDISPLLLLVLALISFPIIAFSFLLNLVILRRLILKTVPEGRMFRSDPKAVRWLLAGLLQSTLWKSPFWGWVNGNFVLRQFYFRGMGARIHGTLIMAIEVKICEPWSFIAGKNVLLGEGVVIAGHKIEREVVTFGEVELGDNVMIGARAVIFPNVKIGAGAVVGAHSMVARGTTIPPGETWAGNPAVRVDLFSGPMTQIKTPKSKKHRKTAQEAVLLQANG